MGGGAVGRDSEMTLFAYLVAWLLFISAVTYLAFWWDKRQAVADGWRISEARLLLLALAGGSLGAKLGQRRFGHKTRKEPFRTTLNLIIVLQVVALPLVASMYPGVPGTYSNLGEFLRNLADPAVTAPKDNFPRRFGPGS